MTALGIILKVVAKKKMKPTQPLWLTHRDVMMTTGGSSVDKHRAQFNAHLLCCRAAPHTFLPNDSFTKKYSRPGSKRPHKGKQRFYNCVFKYEWLGRTCWSVNLLHWPTPEDKDIWRHRDDNVLGCLFSNHFQTCPTSFVISAVMAVFPYIHIQNKFKCTSNVCSVKVWTHSLSHEKVWTSGFENNNNTEHDNRCEVYPTSWWWWRGLRVCSGASLRLEVFHAEAAEAATPQVKGQHRVDTRPRSKLCSSHFNGTTRWTSRPTPDFRCKVCSRFSSSEKRRRGLRLWAIWPPE